METEVKGVKHDQGKLRWDLLPILLVQEVIKVLMAGSEKYEDNNWKHIEHKYPRYWNAAMRHMTQYVTEGQNDDETGLNHLAHAICCMLFLLWEDMKYEKIENDT